MSKQDDMTIGEAEAFRAGWAAAIEAAACEVECGCAPGKRRRASQVLPNSAARWEVCGEASCGSIDAATIRALEPPAPYREERGA